MIFFHHHHHSHKHLTKKEKKELQLKKNKFNQDFFAFVRARKCEAERVKSLNKRTRKPEKKKDDGKVIWSEKVTSIRSRIDGKKRKSEDMWNRFAGTADAGGRGR